MPALTLEVPGPFTEVPLLAVHPARAARVRGTVLHFHGLHEKKERYREALDAMAAHGYLAVGVDSIGHGERRARDYDEQVSRGFTPVLRWVDETAREIPAVLGALDDLIGSERLGRVAVSGVSMGGDVADAAGAREPRVAAVVAILGTPDWTLDGRLPEAGRSWASPHRAAAAFAGKPLLAINCERDDSVPPVHARRFVEALGAGHHEYVEYPKWGHLLSEDHWVDVWRRTLGWLEKHVAR